MPNVLEMLHERLVFYVSIKNKIRMLWKNSTVFRTFVS